MNPVPARATIVMSIALSMAPFWVAGQAVSGPPPALVLRGARVYRSPGEPPLDRAVVILRAGTVERVGPETIATPPGSRVLECAGKTITAGLWNAHVRFAQRKWEDARRIPKARLERELVETFLRHGFTSVVDVGSPLGNTAVIRARIASGEVKGPRIFTAGEILYPPGGAPLPSFLTSIGMIAEKSREVATPRDGIARVQDLLRRGADAIAVSAAVPTTRVARMAPKVLDAISRETHRDGKLLLVHPSDREGLGRALDANADVLLNLVSDAGLREDDGIGRMKAAHVALVAAPERGGFDDATTAQLAAYAAAEGEILFGTGGSPDDDPTESYRRMGLAGMSVRQMLSSLTTAPAARFASFRRAGRLRPGMEADLVVLDADPAVDRTAFSRVRYAIRGGEIVYDRESPVPTSGAARPDRPVDSGDRKGDTLSFLRFLRRTTRSRP
jgi:imidazolonepropionase-like amidohydrolase